MDAHRQPGTAVRSSRGAASTGISLVLATRNHASTIRQTIQEAHAALSRLTAAYEIIVVDDASGDTTAMLAREEARQSPLVKVIALPEPFGHGAALRRGFAAAIQPLVAWANADGSSDLNQLDRLELLSRQHDVAGGYRLESHESWPRQALGWCFNALARLLLRTGVRDCQSGLKLAHREVLQSLPLTESGSLIDAEILAQARIQECSIVEVGINQRPPQSPPRESLLALFVGLAGLVRLWWSAVQFPAGKSPPAYSRPVWTAISGAALLLLLAAPLLLWNLGYPFAEPDENRYSQVALEMFQSGDYVAPTRLGRPFFDKPPLVYWMICASYALGGVSEFTARLPIGLCALATVLATYLLGRRAIGDRAAWLGGVMLLLCCGFALAGRFVLMDMTLALMTTVGLLAAESAARSQRGRLWWWLLAGIACGLGVLTKGPVALIIVVPPLVVATWLSPRTYSVRWHEWLILVGLAGLIAAPWYLLISLRPGDFVGEFFFKHNVQRFTNAFNHREPWWYYLPAIGLGMLPASILLPGLFSFLISPRTNLRELRSPALGFLTLAAVWVVLFFSLSSSKLATYILPAIPMLCLLLGQFVSGVLLPQSASLDLSRQAHLRFVTGNLAKITAVGLALAGLGGVTADVILGGDGLAGRIVCGIVVVGSLALLLAVFRPLFASGRAAWPLVGAAALAFCTYAFNDVYPEGVARRSHLIPAAPEVAQARAAAQKSHVPLVMYGPLAEGTSFYMDASGTHQFTQDDARLVVAFAQEHPQVVLLATPAHARMIAASLPPTVTMQPAEGKRYVYQLSFSPAETLASRNQPAPR